MATLKDFQKVAVLQLDKYTNKMLVVDKTKMRKRPDGNTEVAERYVLDLTKQYAEMSEMTHKYIVELEALAVELIRENYKLRGLTPTDAEVIDRLNKAGLNKFQKVVRL